MSADLVDRYSKPVPRYTSYPTAPHFHAGVDQATYFTWLGMLPEDTSLSLYIHIPYCDRLCWFCGCHTKQVARYEPITAYLVPLFAEIEAVAARLAGKGRVVSVHLGGGSPSMLRPEDTLALGEVLRRHFSFAPDAEISIEIDPNDMDEARYDALAAFGVTRVSLGVQDFDPRVQAAINRIQTFEQTREVVEGMRQRGVGSVNLDVLYGLPFQTLKTIENTIEQALSLAPDRLALFGYAHVLGFGASAIGQLPQGYVQNTVPTGDYQRQVAAGGLAVARGVTVTEDDRARAFVIERLMCDFAVSTDELSHRFGVAATPIVAEMSVVAAEDPDGLTEFADGMLRMTARGRPFVRSIAARFDAHLAANAARYSLAV
jgi:coproporphyrinogen III oxidase-like Fe-S oxidoreductase